MTTRATTPSDRDRLLAAIAAKPGEERAKELTAVLGNPRVGPRRIIAEALDGMLTRLESLEALIHGLVEKAQKTPARKAAGRKKSGRKKARTTKKAAARGSKGE